MAIDAKPSSESVSNLDTSVIDNEIPAYRAVSAAAVTSLALGLCSVFCFTSLWFLVVVVAAVLFGWTALRTIKRLPDILIGSGIARTGIGLSLVFGISAATQVVVQEVMLSYEATQFATQYVEVLKDKPTELAVWYKQPPDYRKTKTPEAIVEVLKQQKSQMSLGDVYTAESEEIRAIKERLKGPNQQIHFVKIESKLVDGLTQYANALLEIDGPPTEAHPQKEQFVLLDLMKAPGAERGDWKVRKIYYPYAPASTVVTTEAKDDGHGHSH